MSGPRKVLVTGATGSQGGAVARQLLSLGHTVRAMTRNPGAAKAAGLRELGAELVKGDFSQPETIEAAATGCDAAFIMSTPFEAGMEAESRQGIAAVDAAAVAGVGHIVLTSVAGARNDTGIPHFDSKLPVEDRVMSCGVPYTILAPVYFMENLHFPQSVEALKAGSFGWPLPPDLVLQQLAVENIGGMGALVIERPDAFAGARIELAGDNLTGPECAKVLASATGREIGFNQVPIEMIRQMSEDLYLMYDWFIRVGYDVDIAALRRDYPEVGWKSYTDWAAAQDWTRLNG